MINIIITRNINVSEKKEIESLCENTETTIYSVHDETIGISNEKKINQTINDNVGGECLKVIGDFGHKVFKNKAIIDWLTFKEKTYWYYLRFSAYFFYFPILKERNIIKRTFDTNEILNPIIYSNFKHEEFDNIDWRVVGNKKKNSISKWANLFNFAIIFFIRVFIGFFQFLLIWNKKNAIAIEPYVIENILDIKNTKKRVKGDYYNEYLTKKALTKKDFFFISDFYFPKLNQKVHIKKRYFLNSYTYKSINFEFFFFISFLNPYIWISIINYRKEFNIALKQLGNEKDTLLEFILRKKNLLTLMHAREIIAKHFYTIKRIKTFTCHHEQSYHHQSLINGAKIARIKTFGFQHGTIHKEHVHYIYQDEDKKFHPIPDYMITWGEHWKNTLINHSIYDPENIIALGQIRTDIIPLLQQEKLNINPKLDLSKKTILLASQTDQIGVETRRQVAINFLKLSKEYSNLNFVIKPHPRENNAILYYSDIAKEVGTTNFCITKDDLYLVLNVSDALITYHSTVASEAVYFKKPVFILNFENNDRDNYLNYKGAFFEVNSYEQLVNYISQLSTGNLKIDQKIQDEFIFKFSNSIDGGASDKYINFINQKISS